MIKPELEISELAAAWEEKWAFVERCTASAIVGMCHPDVVCDAIRDACALQAQLHCAQALDAIEASSQTYAYDLSAWPALSIKWRDFVIRPIARGSFRLLRRLQGLPLGG